MRCGDNGRSTGALVSAIPGLQLLLDKVRAGRKCIARCVRRKLWAAPASFASGEYAAVPARAQSVIGVTCIRETRRKANGAPKRHMRFDLPDLSLFRHVVEAGTITGGAARANLALAAASTRIRNMEEALGAALLVPGRAGIAPSQARRT